MPGSNLPISRYALVGDGLLATVGRIGSSAAGFLPGGGAVAGITRLAIAKSGGAGLVARKGGQSARPPGDITVMDRIRGAIPNISPATARRAGLTLAGVAGAGAAALAGAPMLGALAGRAAGLFGAAAPAGMHPAQAAAMGFRSRRRRMNTLNPHALRRATRRLAGFHHFARTTEAALRHLAPVHHARAPHHGRKH